MLLAMKLQFKLRKMDNLEKQIDNSVDMFLLAAKECGFETPEQIEANFEIISLVAAEMVKDSRERVITKIASNPNWIQMLAAKYQLRVLNQE